MAFSLNGRFLAVASASIYYTTVRLVDVEKARSIKIVGLDFLVVHIAVTGDGGRIAVSGCRDRRKSISERFANMFVKSSETKIVTKAFDGQLADIATVRVDYQNKNSPAFGYARDNTRLILSRFFAGHPKIKRETARSHDPSLRLEGIPN
jgi:hypothetical protein